MYEYDSVLVAVLRLCIQIYQDCVNSKSNCDWLMSTPIALSRGNYKHLTDLCSAIHLDIRTVFSQCYLEFSIDGKTQLELYGMYFPCMLNYMLKVDRGCNKKVYLVYSIYGLMVFIVKIQCTDSTFLCCMLLCSCRKL